MYNYVFGCNGVAIKIETNNKQLLYDLYNLYGEYYSKQSIPSFTIKYIEGLITSDVLQDNQVIDRENENESYNYLNCTNNTLFVYFDKYSNNKFQFMQRIMINVFITELQRHGYVIIHGACVTKDDQGYIISGDKGAGKTTTMLKLLEQGYDFVSNDKVAIKKINGEIIACGIPHSVGIVAEDLDKYRINTQYGRYEYPKVYFKVSELPKALDTSVYNQTTLVGFLFPKYLPRTQYIKHQLCENNLKQIGAVNIFEENAVANQKSYLLDILEPIKYADASVINEIPGYHIVQGDETFDQLAIFIETKNPNRKGR